MNITLMISATIKFPSLFASEFRATEPIPQNLAFVLGRPAREILKCECYVNPLYLNQNNRGICPNRYIGRHGIWSTICASLPLLPLPFSTPRSQTHVCDSQESLCYIYSSQDKSTDHFHVHNRLVLVCELLHIFGSPLGVSCTAVGKYIFFAVL